MLRLILITHLMAFVATAPVFAHQMEDVVHSKNGEIVRGTIIEQILGESLKIQTQDDSVFVCALDEIAKIIKEPATETKEVAVDVEIGTLFGLSHLASDGDGITVIGVPRTIRFGHFGNSSLYVSWFPTEKLSIGPEFSLGHISGGFLDVTSFYLGCRGVFSPQSNAVSGPYLLGHSALLAVLHYYDFDADFSVGVGLGYQWRIGPAFVLRAEGRYRRWFVSDGLFNSNPNPNELSLMLGLGTKTGHVDPEKDAPAPEVEVGTLFGLSHRYSDDHVRLTTIGVPSAFTLDFGLLTGLPLLYILWFPTEKLSIGPEFRFGRTSQYESLDDEDERVEITSLYLGGQGALFLQSNAASGPYLLGHGAWWYSKVDAVWVNRRTDCSVGVGLGYQRRVEPEPAFALRVEGRYRRWFDEGSNEFSLMLGLGTRLGSR